MRNNLIVFICITLYLISSITCVFINKYVLMENTIDSVLLIFVQHISCLMFMFFFKDIFFLKKERDEKNIKESIFSLYNEIKELWPLIITFNFTLVFGNICLKYTSISFYQLARSMTLPFNFFFSYFFFKQIKFNLLMIISCIIVSIGFLIFSLDAVNTNYNSVLYGTIVSIIQAIHLNLIKKKLIIYKDKMVMLYYNLIYSSIILFIYLFITRDIFVLVHLDKRLTFYLILSCISSIFVTFSSFLCIHYTDNVVFNMFGNVKSTVQTFMSKYYNSENFNTHTIIGIILTTSGSCLYTCCSEYSKKRKITSK
ncbi:GDP-fructose:GMP antiporter [Plasmodium falciparum NF54]|uniref:GDP-fructose:GMP antiporter, putative n=2 Tax=Plasmodium falciparum TaxID=5833 RepID=O96200_PLAF7|nr:GDP-fructose:GMP antiporter, putative [Plasmodium falciparum 3D7]KAF4331321.1 GDP-fructose:GMP antiporter [Plasmodium falciparum NF54]PKC46260.1 GDP-fructose:GMP antiporter [Plasmodium falciparum NF54]CZT98133.1 GDP-fructose:GMP antiporter, putative [Plasmodium falciparum 3D7]|eukprot:XP_001349626.2 GDP-fructose:GMP antiporter, putative [Plasmodium falciparum 3D7]